MQNKSQLKAEKNFNVKREGWEAETISEESANDQPDEIFRKVLRGDESKGDPDERDVAGAVQSEDTPHGREEIKTNIKGNS